MSSIGDFYQLLGTIFTTPFLYTLVQINAAGHEPYRKWIGLSLTGVIVSAWAIMAGRITGEWGAQMPYICMMVSLGIYGAACTWRLTRLYEAKK